MLLYRLVAVEFLLFVKRVTGLASVYNRLWAQANAPYCAETMAGPMEEKWSIDRLDGTNWTTWKFQMRHLLLAPGEGTLGARGGNRGTGGGC